MLPVSVSGTTVVTKTHTITLNREVIIDLLRKEGIEVGASVEIFVSVPGGGDWSNTDLDISASCPLIVRWTESESSVV